MATVMMHGVLMLIVSLRLSSGERRGRRAILDAARGGHYGRACLANANRAVMLHALMFLDGVAPMPTLTLAQANEIAAKALEKARAMKIKPVTVVVLDDAGHLKAMQREDGASMFRFDVATGKAWAAVGMGASSRALAGRAKDNPNFFITLAATAGGKFLPQIGGVLIRDASGAILGAAGASGGTGEEDEAVCAFGIEQAGLVADAKA
jgi:uncharacterized protein GlcG (DUF336 family)